MNAVALESVRPRPDRIVNGRRYYDSCGRAWPASQECEHCDGVEGAFVRSDALRGLVCPRCDDALDEMLDETPPSTSGIPGEKK